MNNTTHSADFELMVLSFPSKVLIGILYSIILLVGVPGNAMVIYDLGVRDRFRKSCDIHLVALAFSDMLSSLFVPILNLHDLVTNLVGWALLGTFGCKFFLSIQHISMLVSAFILILISLERLRVIESDTVIRSIRRSAPIKIGFVWFLAIGIVSPFIYALIVKDGHCQQDWDPHSYFYYYVCYITFSCFLPAFIIISVYTRSVYLLTHKVIPRGNRTITVKRQVQYQWMSKLFFIIAVVYFVLTMPNVVIHFISMYFGTFERAHYMEHHKLLQSLLYGLQTFSNFNSCINPFIYAHMHDVLRRNMRKRISSILQKQSASKKDISLLSRRTVIKMDTCSNIRVDPPPPELAPAVTELNGMSPISCSVEVEFVVDDFLLSKETDL